MQLFEALCEREHRSTNSLSFAAFSNAEISGAPEIAEQTMRQQLRRVWLAFKEWGFPGWFAKWTHTHSRRCMRVTLVLCKTQLPTVDSRARGQPALMFTCAKVEHCVSVCVCVVCVCVCVSVCVFRSSCKSLGVCSALCFVCVCVCVLFWCSVLGQ